VAAPTFDQRAGRRAFGDNVRLYRRRASLTQERLAEGANLDRSYLVGIERGLRNPSLDVILRLARALGVAPADLFH
jgi:transcriptional regulator with XRE-family HTH domain